jgi:hypothetical protein
VPIELRQPSMGSRQVTRQRLARPSIAVRTPPAHPLSSSKRGGSSSRDSNATSFRQSTMAPASTTAGSASRLANAVPVPMPGELAFTGALGNPGSALLVLLLFFLAAALAAFCMPGVFRTITVVLRTPRPHPYRLALERPD